MKRHLPLPLTFVCALILGSFLALPEAAEARCDALCVRVEPGCRECVHTGEFTGANCIQHGACFCIYTECTSALQSSVEVSASPDDVPEFLRQQPAMTEQASEEAACDLATLLSLQTANPAAG